MDLLQTALNVPRSVFAHGNSTARSSSSTVQRYTVPQLPANVTLLLGVLHDLSATNGSSMIQRHSAVSKGEVNDIKRSEGSTPQQ